MTTLETASRNASRLDELVAELMLDMEMGPTAGMLTPFQVDRLLAVRRFARRVDEQLQQTLREGPS